MRRGRFTAVIAIGTALLLPALSARDGHADPAPHGGAQEAADGARVRPLDDELRDARRAIKRAVGFKARQQALLEARRTILTSAARIAAADPGAFGPSDDLDYSFAKSAFDMIPEAGFTRADCDDIRLEIRVGFDPQRRGMPEEALRLIELLDAVCSAAGP
jgi:hypothetical protein